MRIYYGCIVDIGHNFFFQNSLGLSYLYQSLNNFEFFFIRIPSGDNTIMNIETGKSTVLWREWQWIDDTAAISPPIKQYCVHYRGPILKVWWYAYIYNYHRIQMQFIWSKYVNWLINKVIWKFSVGPTQAAAGVLTLGIWMSSRLSSFTPVLHPPPIRQYCMR